MSMSSDVLKFLNWWLFVVVIGWIVYPISYRFFRNIPDRGITISKSLGILLAGFLHWLLSYAGLSQNSQAGIWIVIIMLLGFSVLIFFKSEKQELINWVRNNARLILITEFIFFIAFVAMAVLRSYNPDILGTEKPMELMFINSILRSESFPPNDAWLSGYSISYYYFGYIMVAMIAKLTATSAGLAFNLTIALIFALTFIAAFGLVFNLIAHKKWPNQILPIQLLKIIPISIVGPVILLLVGNFYGILEVLHKHHVFANFNVPTVWFETGKIDPISQTLTSPQVLSGRINFWEWMDLKQLGPIEMKDVPFQGIQQGNWFFASRTIHDRNLTGYDPEAIDEFPAFSFLLADLHPHVLGLPFVILVILMSFEWMLDIRQQRGTLDLKWDRILLSSIMLGSLIFLNTWDFPIYVFLFGVSVLAAAFIQQYKGVEWKSLIISLLPVFRVILLSVVCYVPFLVGLQSQAGGIIPNTFYPTKFRQAFVMFGPLLIGIVAFLVVVLHRYKKEVDYKFAWKFAGFFLVGMVAITSVLIGIMLLNPNLASLVNGAIAPFTFNQALGWLLIRRIVEGGTLLVGILLMVGTLAFLWGLKKKGSESLLFVFIMIFTGTLLLLGPEFVYLRDNFGWRMNTLFKFYFQIWILWALSAGFGFWYVLQKLKGWRKITISLVVGLGFLLGAVYTVGTIQTTTQSMRQSVMDNGMRSPTLDGLMYYRLYYPDDWMIIDWLNQNVRNPAVVLEGTKGAYWVEGRSSRVSMMTGIPTVMGWVNHQSQWRGEYFANVAMREADIRTIYTVRDWATAKELMDQYGITHVIVSPLEREWYGAIQQNKFDQNMQRVFEINGAVIYQR